jgi:hypothetical protein
MSKKLNDIEIILNKLPDLYTDWIKYKKIVNEENIKKNKILYIKKLNLLHLHNIKLNILLAEQANIMSIFKQYQITMRENQIYSDIREQIKLLNTHKEAQNIQYLQLDKYILLLRKQQQERQIQIQIQGDVLNQLLLSQQIEKLQLELFRSNQLLDLNWIHVTELLTLERNRQSI